MSVELEDGRRYLAQISIIITAYNVQDYIATAIDSALHQQGVDVEVIVVVDGGHDNTAAIVNSFAQQHAHLKVLVKANGGVSSARNAGLALATADYIMFLDGDDKLLANACQQFLQTAQTCHADIVVSDYFSQKEGSQQQKLKSASDFSPMSGPEFALAILAPKSTVSVWNKCYKKSLFAEVRFPENVSMGEDLLTLFDVSMRAQRVVPLAEPTLVYLIRNSSLVNSSSQHLLSITVVMSMLKARLAATEFPAELKQDIYAATAFYHVMYSRVVRDERFGDIHYKMFQWAIAELKIYSPKVLNFIATLPRKERLLLACYRYSYFVAISLVRLNVLFRRVFASKE